MATGEDFESISIHIMYIKKLNEEYDVFHLQTLVVILDSEEATKEAMLYSYNMMEVDCPQNVLQRKSQRS